MKFEYKPISGNKVSLDLNGELTTNAENLKLKTQKFKEEYKVFRMDNPTFTEKVSELIKNRKWNSSIFKDKTLLDDPIYSRIINKKEDKKWKFRTIVAVCVGLELSLKTTEDLLERAGHTFSTSEEHQAYKFLFTEFRGWPIDECNAFLESIKLPPLGSNARKSKS